MNTHIPPNIALAEPPQELLSVKQAAAFAVVSKSTVRRWLKGDGLPFYRAGRQIRIDKRDLVNFLRNSVSQYDCYFPSALQARNSAKEK
jgi:excisionase family DNA binding protein